MSYHDWYFQFQTIDGYQGEAVMIDAIEVLPGASDHVIRPVKPTVV